MTSRSADDPHRLADELEHEVERLEQHTAEVGERTRAVRDDWERKRRDPSVPGAPAPQGEARDDDSEEPHSEAPDAPPESEGPSASRMPSEGAAGPPADQVDDGQPDGQSDES